MATQTEAVPAEVQDSAEGAQTKRRKRDPNAPKKAPMPYHVFVRNTETGAFEELGVYDGHRPIDAIGEALEQDADMRHMAETAGANGGEDAPELVAVAARNFKVAPYTLEPPKTRGLKLVQR